MGTDRLDWDARREAMLARVAHSERLTAWVADADEDGVRLCDACGHLEDAGERPDWVNGMCLACDPPQGFTAADAIKGLVFDSDGWGYSVVPLMEPTEAILLIGAPNGQVFRGKISLLPQVSQG